MGIPSFYRHLCRQLPSVIGKGVGSAPAWLCLDFNCAMYYVLRRQPPYVVESHGAWERDFQADIAAYMSEIIGEVRPTAGVYISCDGVVCAAKRRQQRLRRFKGPWMSGLESDVKRPTTTSRWDQNALTPGTVFMSALSATLKSAATSLSARLKIPVVVSDTEEPGEGEHKLLAKMRSVGPTTCSIYGLDADLILLALLLESEGTRVTLVREAQEFEMEKRPAEVDAAEWRNLSVTELKAGLLGTVGGSAVRDFVAAMSLLGNDFLPRSLTRTVRDEGIPTLIADLRHLWSKGEQLVDPATGRLRRAALLELVERWAATEEVDMLCAIQRAVRAAAIAAAGGHKGDNGGPEEAAMRAWQSQPAVWCSVARLLAPGLATARLCRDWRRVYATWKPGSATDYIQGLAWVADYYTGRPVDLGWAYDAHLPPLWSEIAAALAPAAAGPGDFVEPPPITWATALPSWTHLVSVLPRTSVDVLLPRKRGTDIIRANPHWWPSGWTVFDVGRTQLWECEVLIPVIPETVLRAWASSDKK